MEFFFDKKYKRSRQWICGILVGSLLGGILPSGEILASDSVKPVKKELVDYRTANSKLIDNGNGTLTKEIFSEPAYRKVGDQWLEISNKLIKKSDLIVPENVSIKVAFNSKMKQGQYSTLESGEHTLSYRFLDASGLDKKESAKDVEATFKDNKVTYPEIIPSVDLQNTVFDQSVKEDIVLSKYTGLNQFRFELNTDLTPVKQSDGSILFEDKSKKTLFELPAPHMYDSNVNPISDEPAKSTDVAYNITKEKDKWILSLTADEKWLQDPSRKFPIYIDPTTDVNAGTGDTFVSDAYPTTNYANFHESKGDYYSLKVGRYDSSSGMNHAYIKQDLSGLSDVIVDSAEFRILTKHSASSSPTAVYLDAVNQEWNPNTLTWNQAKSLTSSRIGSVNVAKGQWATFDVTNTVKSWLSSPPTKKNYGFKLHTDGSTNSSLWKKFQSSDNTSQKPYLSITYRLSTPEAPTGIAYSNWVGSDSGFIDLKWKPVPGATGYKVWAFNGKEYEVVKDVGNVTSWSTHGKGIWPTTEEIKSGKYQLHSDGKGIELPLDPSPVYRNSGGTYGSSKSYFFSITAYRPLGESAISKDFNATIPARSEDLGMEEFWQYADVSGDKVNAVTGNLVMDETDAKTGGRGPAVEIGRTYNSRSTEAGAFGLGWTFSESMKEDGNGNVIYTDEDGTVHQFTKNSDGTYTKPLGVYLELAKDATGFTMTDKDQVKSFFDLNGKLVKVQDNDKNAVTYTYNDSKQLTSITDASGRATTITYQDGKIESVKAPGNRVWKYGYKGDLLTSVTNPENEVTKYGYTENLLTSVKEPSDTADKPAETIYEYAEGRVTSVQDALKRKTTLAYDTSASKVTVTSPGKKVTEYYYNISGNPAKMVVDPGGLNLTTTYEYDHNNMTSTKDPNANKAGESASTESYKYDGNGNVTEATDASGTEKMQYNQNNDVTKYTDSNNKDYKSVYDGTKEISSTDPEKVSTAKTYDANGNVRTSTKELGLAENLITNSGFERSDEKFSTAPADWEREKVNEGANYSLDSTTKVGGDKSLKLATSSTSASLGYIGATQVIPVQPGETYTFSASVKTDLKNANAFLNTMQLDDSMKPVGGTWSDNRHSQLTGTSDWTKRQVSFTAGANTSYVRIYLEVDHTNSNTSGAAWFDNVQLEKGAASASYNGLENSGFEDGLAFWYKSSGDGVLDSTEALDGTNSIKFNRNSVDDKLQQFSQALPVKQTKAKPITISGMSKANNVVNASTTAETDPSQVGYGIVVDAIDVNGKYYTQAVKFTPGTHDWQRAAITIFPDTPIDRIAVYPRLGYKNTGTVWFDNIRIQDGSVISSNEYDDKGNHVIKATDPLGNSTKATYDEVGNNLTSTDENGNTKATTYDKMNRVKSVALPGADVKVQYEHDKDGNVIEKKVTSKDGSTTYNSVKLKYDETGKLISSTDPLGKVTSYTYDEDGQQIKVTLPDRSILESVYDKAGRVVEAKLNETTRYKSTYDANGQEIKVEDVQLNQSKTRAFDKSKRLTNMTTAGGSMQWDYDPNDNLKEVKITNGSKDYTHAFSYNSVNKNTLITDPNGKKYRFDYDENGNVGTLILGNGSGVSTIYDENNQLTHMNIGKNDGTVIASYDYTYDKNGNRTSVKDHTGKVIQYTYDEQNQLLSETDPASNNIIHYSYDPIGNRKSKTIKDSDGKEISSIIYRYNAMNQLTNVDGQAYAYSENGNLTDDGKNLYVWDAGGRLTQVKKKSDNSIVAQYDYDEDNRRIRSTVGGVVTNYVYDGDSIRVLYETNETNQMTRYYTYSASGGLLSMTKAGGETYYYHTNAHGDVISMTDGNNNIVASYTYDAWGNIVAKSGTLADENPYRYASYRYDNETSFYYLMARYYNAKNGNFISMDPDPGDEDDIQTQNGYTYGNNNPVNTIDPDGHWAWLAGAVVGAGLGYLKYKIEVKYGYRTYNKNHRNVHMYTGATLGFIGGRVQGSMKSAGYGTFSRERLRMRGYYSGWLGGAVGLGAYGRGKNGMSKWRLAKNVWKDKRNWWKHTKKYSVRRYHRAKKWMKSWW
ncbi:DNRLRE domain-containing protein [Thermoactinomyces sp. DSM 45892]|uniref:DNRLRE domain-containing protein n=1 Tax=Thermoactinomyces sp. DSM 45892 TaxID=1882753 RepID=UPI00089D95A4|nr:DNRLRE domain-containing protein [Thermoactinomyces sp. DSM 45892]SDY35714.1 RHS repeat-associated core domain-containing protein [Thermoactinomyces sp. DSM 45892]